MGATAVVYARLSRSRANKASLSVQEADCRAWAVENGMTVVEVCIDEGRSAFAGGRRPGLERALELVERGDVTALLVWKLDRLTREGPARAEFIAALVAGAGARLIAVHDGVDTAGPAAGTAVGELARLAQAESVNTGLRVQSAKARLRSEGRWIGGQPPYGLSCRDGKLYVSEPEARVVRAAAEKVLAGASLVGVARALNAAGVVAPRGGQWTAGSLAQLLLGPVTAGWSPETVKDDSGRYTSRVVPWICPQTGDAVSVMAEEEAPVLAPELQARVRSALAARRRDTTATRSHLLTGLLRCESCGRRMSAWGRAYVCQSRRTGGLCPKPVSALESALDSAVMEACWERVEGGSGDILAVRRILCVDEGRGTADLRAVADVADCATRQHLVRALISTAVVKPGVRGRRFHRDARLVITWKARD